MSGWSRTNKPTVDKTVDSANVFGVDTTEIVLTPGIAAPGWAVRRVVGSRVIWETLVAMRTPPTEDGSDDAVLPSSGGGGSGSGVYSTVVFTPFYFDDQTNLTPDSYVVAVSGEGTLWQPALYASEAPIGSLAIANATTGELTGFADDGSVGGYLGVFDIGYTAINNKVYAITYNNEVAQYDAATGLIAYVGEALPNYQYPVYDPYSGNVFVFQSAFGGDDTLDQIDITTGNVAGTVVTLTSGINFIGEPFADTTGNVWAVNDNGAVANLTKHTLSGAELNVWSGDTGGVFGAFYNPTDNQVHIVTATNEVVTVSGVDGTVVSNVAIQDITFGSPQRRYWGGYNTVRQTLTLLHSSTTDPTRLIDLNVSTGEIVREANVLFNGTTTFASLSIDQTTGDVYLVSTETDLAGPNVTSIGSIVAWKEQ